MRKQLRVEEKLLDWLVRAAVYLNLSLISFDSDLCWAGTHLSKTDA